jgi:hypothetical protein
MKVNRISLGFVAHYFNFIQIRCFSLTLTFSAFETWHQNFILNQTDSKFWNFTLDDGESQKKSI